MTDQLTSRGAFVRDDNSIPITGLGLIASKAITYVAGTTGAIAVTDLFTVTGTVAIKVIGVCSVDLTGAGTLEVGITGNTAAIIAQTTGTDIDAGEIWYGVTPVTVGTMPEQQIVSSTIQQKIASATITAGTITYYCMWTPISTDGNLIAA